MDRPLWQILLPLFLIALAVQRAAAGFDLRVDDHERPLTERRRLHRMFRREYPAP